MDEARLAYDEALRQMFASVTQALVEDGLISSGHAVLDIATGPGEPALTIAALVGPEGKVFGIDPAPEIGPSELFTSTIRSARVVGSTRLAGFNSVTSAPKPSLLGFAIRLGQ
jgi:hypothetical protein